MTAADKNKWSLDWTNVSQHSHTALAEGTEQTTGQIQLRI